MTSVLPLTADELLTTTRSVRKRLDLDRPVPLELVRECLEVALQAPSGSNAQGWHFVVVTDPDLRAAIGEYYERSYSAYKPHAEKAMSELPDGRREAQGKVRSSSDHLADVMGRVPVLVLACITASDELPASNQAGLWGSIIPAAWSYMLAARARGLGSAWTTLHLRYEKEIAELLGMPSNVRQAVLLPTAYFTGDTFRPAKREPLESVVHVDRW